MARKGKETIIVRFEDEGRLDRFLASRYGELSRTFLQRLINRRHVMVDRHPVSPSHKLKTGQTIVIEWPRVEPKKKSESRDTSFLTFLYEDDAMLVVDKPAGLVVHPAAGHFDGDTLVEILKDKINTGPWPDEVRPGLVHRLDRDTSGVIALAKSPEAHAYLSQQFSRRQVKKIYHALAQGFLEAKEGTIESHLSRHPGKRQRFAVSAGGRWASTRFHVLRHFGEAATLVELQPLTGRTHQIRVHLASMGHPILGDHVYGKGGSSRQAPRQMLHAASLAIHHPETKKEMTFSAPLPSDFQHMLKILTSPLP